jgi:hypothetical protein
VTQPGDHYYPEPGEYFVPAPDSGPPPYLISTFATTPAYGAGPSAPLTPLSAAMALAWIACAILSITAPFLTYVGYGFSSSFTGDSTEVHVDGWGHIGGVPVAAGHGVIWGIPMVLIAAGFVVATLGVFWRRPGRWPALLGSLAAVALIAVAASVALYWEAGSSAATTSDLLEWHAGAGLWMTMIGGLVAVFATILSVRALSDDTDDGRRYTESTLLRPPA